jgi:hypothetical protein
MSDYDDWKLVCTDAVFKGEKLCQIPYYNGKGSFICRACFQLCRDSNAKEFK